MIKELSSLRFVFIFLIFLHHIGMYQGGGAMAVAFFFILLDGVTLGYIDKEYIDNAIAKNVTLWLTKRILPSMIVR